MSNSEIHDSSSYIGDWYRAPLRGEIYAITENGRKLVNVLYDDYGYVKEICPIEPLSADASVDVSPYL